jgi:hypothetical protein
MTLTITGTEATKLKDFYGGFGGLSSDIVLTFPVAASTSIKKGDILKLTGGYVEKCDDTTDVAMGIATEDKDNSSGSAGDLEISVKVRGFAKVDGVILDDASTYDAAFVAGTKVGLATAGQVVASYGGTTDPTVCVGKCFSTQTVSAGADITRIVYVYFDFLGLPDQA